MALKLSRAVPVIFALIFSVLLTADSVTQPAPTQPLLDQGYRYMYDLKFDAAHVTIAKYEQTNSSDPMGPVSDAAAYLFDEFDRLHILRSDFFVEDKVLLNSKKLQPDSKTARNFEVDLDRSRRLADAALQHLPGDSNAMMANVLRIALDANYLALIEKQYWKALKEIKDAQGEADKLLQQCPDCFDANLAIGVENYLLSQKPAPERWLLHFAGAETDKDKGIQNLRIVAEKGHYLKPYAKILLAIAALRDNRKSEAEQLMTELAAQFPANDLFRAELKKLKS